MDLLRVAFEDHGLDCELLVASDGEIAFSFIEQSGHYVAERPALAILDLNLPKKTGREILQRIRESAEWENIPVVILSSSDSERDRAETSQLGASLYIKKPSNLDDFVKIGAVIKSLLSTSP